MPYSNHDYRQRDFQYAWAKKKQSKDMYGFPGRVHAGFFAVFRYVSRAALRWL